MSLPVLIDAAAVGDIEKVKNLLNSQVDIHTKDAQGYTALHHAAGNGKLEVVQMLILYGADVNARSFGDNVTPLFWACDSGFTQVAQLLIASHADVDLPTSSGRTALHVVSSKGFEPLVSLLTDSHANPNAVDDNGETPLFYAINAGHERIVGWLVEHAGARVDVANVHNWTPLHGAAYWNQAEVVLFLIQHKADVNAQDDHGYSPLHVTGDPACIRVLIMHGASIAAQSMDGQTAVHRAVAKSNKASLLALLQEGADVNAATVDDWTPLHEASDMGNAEIVKILLAHGAAVDRITNTGWTALHLAAGRGHVEICHMLVDARANVNAKTAEGYTALHWAARRGDERNISYLIQYGADVNSLTADGQTPLHWATTKSQASAIHLLLSQGANPNFRDADGLTAADLPVPQNIRNIILSHAASHPSGVAAPSPLAAPGAAPPVAAATGGPMGPPGSQALSSRVGGVRQINTTQAERDLATHGTISAEVAQQLLEQIRELNIRLKNEEEVRKRAIRAMQERSARKGPNIPSSSVVPQTLPPARQSTSAAAVPPNLGGSAGAANPKISNDLVDSAIQFITKGLPQPFTQAEEDDLVNMCIEKDEKLLALYRNFVTDPAKFKRFAQIHLKEARAIR